MSQLIGRGASLLFGSLLCVACGNGDDWNPNAGQVTPVMLPAPEVTPQPIAEPEGESDAPLPSMAVPAPGVSVPAPGGSNAAPGVNDGPEQSEADPNNCVTPLGVSGTPRDLEEAIILMNALPKPTSLACFLQSLSRPLDVYMTRSDQSLQPSPGERSPRTFIVFEPLVMSIVFEGPGRPALELGYRSTPTRSIKTEILFPLTTEVTATNLFDEVVVGESTRCSACHSGEVQMLSPAFPAEVFESDIIEPFSVYEVSVESLRVERESCNVALEPDRCAMLAAFFDFGTINAAPKGIMF